MQLVSSLRKWQLQQLDVRLTSIKEQDELCTTVICTMQLVSSLRTWQLQQLDVRLTSIKEQFRVQEPVSLLLAGRLSNWKSFSNLLQGCQIKMTK
ncbi:hypothetical protein AVEN_51359-1 [Araneus ventricosus]|uniref:Uncharacterized protein n=1 Tax=Araneus ventricosus TaxID=182803 RepID=A0A4Y2HDI7_ARAVE|nr:hypothetical protein AVEN_51359-1 [Araneus ventricosus]